MLLPESDQKLTELKELQDVYMPNQQVAAELQTKTLIMLVGPTCVGKTTIMQEVVQTDKHFAITGTFTTRERREDDHSKNYAYIPHNDQGIAQVYDMVKSGKAVQYALHPTSGRIYGSDISHYPKEFDMLDTLSAAVANIEQLPARKTVVIGVAVAPEHWRQWFGIRFPAGHPDRHKRLLEAIQSLQWLLDRPEGTMHWVVNAPNELAEAAQRIIAISTGVAEDDPTGHETAEALLKCARELSA